MANSVSAVLTFICLFLIYERRSLKLIKQKGAFGTCPIPVWEAAQGYRRRCEKAPDKFYRYHYASLLDESRRHISQLLNIPADECAFVPNATAGVNTVLRNLQYKYGDCIIYFDTIYGANRNTLLSIVETNPDLQLRKVEYRLPCSHADILDALLKTIAGVLRDQLTLRLCLFETIVSIPGVRLPFEQISSVCRKHGILSLVDGAHGVGQIPLDLSELDADFFITNAHKWLYTPRSCAILHVPKRNQHLIRTTFPTSWNWIPAHSSASSSPTQNENESRFTHLFADVGTLDSSPYYCVPAALEFRRRLCGGEAAIHDYIRDIAQRGADLLATLLGTEVMDDRPNRGEQEDWTGGLRDCALANVLLPVTVDRSQESQEDLARTVAADTAQFNSSVTVKVDDLPAHAEWMQRTLNEEYHMGVTIFSYDDKLWARVCGQIYVELSDFELLANAIKDVIERVRCGEGLDSH